MNKIFLSFFFFFDLIPFRTRPTSHWIFLRMASDIQTIYSYYRWASRAATSRSTSGLSKQAKRAFRWHRSERRNRKRSVAILNGRKDFFESLVSIETHINQLLWPEYLIGKLVKFAQQLYIVTKSWIWARKWRPNHFPFLKKHLSYDNGNKNILINFKLLRLGRSGIAYSRPSTL